MRKFRIILLCVLCLASCSIPESKEEERTDYDPDLRGWRTASWSPFTIADSITGFTYGNGRYVAVSDTGIIAWSSDGDVWNRASISPETFSAGLRAVAFGDGRFVAVGDEGKYAWSESGENWNGLSDMVGFGTENINGVAWGEGRFVAVGGNANISSSSNGRTWSGCRDPAFWDSDRNDFVALNDVAYDMTERRFYIVGNGGHRGWTSNLMTDENYECDWHHKGPEPPFYSDNITKVTAGRYGGGTGIGVVFGARTAIATRGDFTGFDADLEAFLLESNRLNGIAWGGGYFVVAGTSAMIGHWLSAEPSNNGTRVWSAYSFPEFKRWEITALEACNGRFFIGNIGGKIGFSK